MSFNELFVGNQERFLTFNPKSLAPRDDGKSLPDYRTVKRLRSDGTELGPDEWAEMVNGAVAEHLHGRQSFGLSPLRSGKVRFAALDIDLYNSPSNTSCAGLAEGCPFLRRKPSRTPLSIPPNSS